MDIKRRFAEDFEKSSQNNLSFDLSQLEANQPSDRYKGKSKKKRVTTIVLVAVGAVFVGVLAVPVLAFFRVSSSVHLTRRNYTASEMAIAESNTFKALNHVAYPSADSPVRSALRDEEKSSYINFSNSTYHAMVDASNANNACYSPLGLYSTINELRGASSRDDLSEKLDNLLGLENESRVFLYSKMMGANSFACASSTIQLRNVAFFNNRFSPSRDYVDYLTSLYCQAYSMDFKADAGKIIEWADRATDSSNFIDNAFLEIDDQSEFLLLSSVYFKSAWRNKYLSENNVSDPFYLSSGSTVTATYMKHSYFADCYYDYGSYISVKDYYLNSWASVTYLVPKDVNQNIFELTKSANIFEEDSDKKVLTPNGRGTMVELKTPKFHFKADSDFKSCLRALDLGEVFDPNINSFGNAFSDENAGSTNFYLQNLKQRNEVEFNEDGSTVRSISFGAGAGGSAPLSPDGGLEVELNQPFIYIIKDINDMPIFVGHVDNPTLS